MKIHFKKEILYTGNAETHFRTTCGKIRHRFTNMKVTTDSKKVTCKVCACKK